MKIVLNNNKGFSWFHNENIYVKGYFFDKQDTLHQKQNLLYFLTKLKTQKEFLNTLKTLNGIFSIIITIEKTTIIASDTTRSFPLFYNYNSKKIHISDDIQYLKNKLSISKFNKKAEIEYTTSLHTHGKKTLLKDIFQVQSNEYLIIKDDKIIESNFFFSYATTNTNTSDYKTLKEQTQKVIENSFKRCIKSLNNRTVILPLSGGFDSRLIAVMLKKNGYKKVVCYTYGNKNSCEIENSKNTAKALNYKWHFIEYTKEIIEDYIEKSEFKEYAHHIGKYSSTPNLQEYFAIKYIKEQKLCPEDSIFIPGYAGDLLGGSQFLKVIPKNLKSSKIIDLILSQKFFYNSLSIKDSIHLKKDIYKNLKKINPTYNNQIASSVFEDYDIKEKIAKYIFNSASFYSFFNYEYRFPFWDLELISFFKSVPEKYKHMKILFDEVLKDSYFKPFNILFENELQPSKKRIYLQKIKNKIKPILPNLLIERLLQKNDWNNYKPITEQMRLSLKKNNIYSEKKIFNYNEIINQWYLSFCKNKIK